MAAVSVTELGKAKVYLRQGKMVLTTKTPDKGVVPKALEPFTNKFGSVASQCSAATRGLPTGKRGAAYKGCIAQNMRR